MGGDPIVLVETRVREEIRRRGVDPVRDSGVVRDLVDEVLADWDEQALAGVVTPVGDRADAARTVLSNVAGLGPLQQYLDDPEVEEIWINRPSQVFVARRGVSELTPTILTDAQVRDLVEHMLKVSGRRLDLSSPFVDASLPGGERLHAVIPDVTREHWSVNIRKYVAKAHNVGDLVALGTLTEQAARFLDAAVACGLNLLVAGGTQAGKTTTLGALAGSIPARERIITCEEVFELAFTTRIHICEQVSTPESLSIATVLRKESRANARTRLSSRSGADGTSPANTRTTTRPHRARFDARALRHCSRTSTAVRSTR